MLKLEKDLIKIAVKSIDDPDLEDACWHLIQHIDVLSKHKTGMIQSPIDTLTQFFENVKGFQFSGLSRDDLIPLIKGYRAVTGLGLKEAKEFMEKYVREESE